MQYLIFNWRQLGENIADPSTSTSNSSRTVENHTIVLFWLLTGLKFWIDLYIFGYVLKKKFFRLIRGGPVTSWSHCNECPNISRWHEVDFEALLYVYHIYEKKFTSYVQTGLNPLATGLVNSAHGMYSIHSILLIMSTLKVIGEYSFQKDRGNNEICLIWVMKENS